MMPSVLYLSYDGALDPLGQSQVLPYLEGLALRGFEIHLLSFEKGERWEDRESRSRASKHLASAGITWHPLPYHKRPPVLSTAWDLISGFFRGLRMDGVNLALIHARSYPAALLGAWLGRISGVPLLFDIRAFFPEERVEGGYWRRDGVLYRAAKGVESGLLARAAGIVTLTEASVPVLQQALERMGAGTPIRTIPTCVDMDRFKPAPERRRVHEALGIGCGPVVVHIGTLGGWYRGEDTFLLAGACLERMGGQFVVLTEQIELARELSRKTGVSATLLSVRHGDVPLWLSASDLGLALVRPGFAKTASSPTKVGEYLASGMAVVGTAGVGDLTAQFEGSAVARAIHPGESPAAVAAWAETAIRRTHRQTEARRIAGDYYDLEKGIDVLAGFYEELGVHP